MIEARCYGNLLKGKINYKVGSREDSEKHSVDREVRGEGRGAGT